MILLCLFSFFHEKSSSDIPWGRRTAHKVQGYAKWENNFFRNLTFNLLPVFVAFSPIIGWSLFWKHPNWQLIKPAWRLSGKPGMTSTVFEPSLSRPVFFWGGRNQSSDRPMLVFFHELMLYDEDVTCGDIWHNKSVHVYIVILCAANS